MKDEHTIDGIVSIHEHLGGGTSSQTLWKAGNKMGFKFKSQNYRDFANSLIITSNNDYFNAFHLTEKIQSNSVGMEMSVFSVFEDAYLAGVDYLELRFNPAYRTVKNVFDMDKIIMSGIIGMERAKSVYGIGGGLIFCMDRTGPKDLNRVILDKAIDYQKKGVIGIDVAGKETQKANSGLISSFGEFFNIANTFGLGTTIHLGECYYDCIQDDAANFLQQAPVDRIGHGISLVHSQKCVELIQEKGIVMEICPSSNISNGYASHHSDIHDIVEKFIVDHKIPVAIGTDSRQLLQTSVVDELGLIDYNILALNTLNKKHLFS